MKWRIWPLALAVIIAAAADAPAQTTSARSDSLEVSRRADDHFSSRAFARAARLYRRALEIDATNERAYVGLSMTLDRQSKHRAALELLDEAQSRLGWTVELGLQRGIHLSRLDRWLESIVALDKVLARDPDSYGAAYHLGRAHLALSHWQEAIDGYTLYLGKRPERPYAGDKFVRNRRALALLALGDHRQARREAAAVLAAVPDDRSARMLMFTALAKTGDCEAALALFAELEELAAAAPTLLYNAAVCEFRLGDGRAALARLDAHHRHAKAPPREPLLRARIYAALDDDARARTSYRQAIAAGLPAAAEFAGWLAARGEHDEAIAMLWPLVEGGSQDPDLLQLTASTLQTAASWERAIIAGKRLVELRPDAASWRLLGDLELGRQGWAAAEVAYLRARELDPSDGAAAIGLSRSLFARATVELGAGHRTAAHALIERAHRADPSAAAITYNLALLELADHPHKTIELLGPALDHIDDPRAHLLIGRAYHAVGDNDAARRSFSQVAAAQSGDVGLQTTAHAYLGHLFAASAPEQALTNLTRARALGGADAEVDHRLAEAEAVAQLALAEEAYRRDDAGKLGPALARVVAANLPAATRARARLLQIYASAGSRGATAALRQLDAISDDDLAALSNGKLALADLRQALALVIAGPAIRRPRDFSKRLRAAATALHSGGAAGSALVSAWYDNVLASAMSSDGNDGLARALARATPRAAAGPSLRHNIVVAVALTRAANKRFTANQRRDLDNLAPGVTEALINLAIASEARGDQPSALGYLRRIPAPRRRPAISEWLRWKELLHGTP